MTADVVVAVVAGLGGAAVLTPVAMAVARRTGIVDRPGPLKPQQAAVPYLGGLAVLAALVPGAVVGRASVLAPLAGAAVLGVLDDRFGLAPSARLVGQVAVGAGVAATVPTHLGAAGGVLAAVVTVILVNGVNFLDGLDGLAAGVLALSALTFAFVLHGAGRDLAAGAAGALVGFLMWNRPPARVYLGDAGAYLLGTLAAVLLTWTWAPGRATATGVAGLVVLAVPVAEVVFAVVRRARARQSLTSGDRRHPYDLIVASGRGRGTAVWVYVAVEAVLAAAAWGAAHAHSLALPVALALTTAVVLTAAAAATGALSGGPRVPA